MEDISKCIEEKHKKRRHPVYDAQYCLECMIWIENNCSDPECCYCPTRPNKPSREHWIDVDEEKPVLGQSVLVVVTYLDAEFDVIVGGYKENTNYWMQPFITKAAYYGEKTFMGSWSCGGKVIYWRELPELPQCCKPEYWDGSF